MSATSGPDSSPTVIIGGGISGLSAAYYLGKRGLPSILIDSAPRLGGVIQTDTVADCLLEGGPDSFLSAKPEALALIEELGLGGEVIGSNDHQRATWIWREGRMRPLPDGLMMMVPTRVMPTVKSSLFSWTTKLRMGLELLRRPPARQVNRSVGEFIEDHYGREAVDYLAEPLLAGIYGGDPYKLSVNSVLPRFTEMETKYGSLTKGTLAGLANAPKKSGTLFRTLKRGLGSLAAALEKAIEAHTGIRRDKATNIAHEGDRYLVRLDSGTLSAANVIIATPAWAAAEILQTLDPSLAASLASIDYSSSLTAGVIYDRASVPQSFKAFGFLVPKKEQRDLVACTFVDQKFNHRVPPNRLLLRCFLGGDTAIHKTDADLQRIVLTDLKYLLGLDVSPIAFQVSRWPRSMAQYEVGHMGRIAGITERLKLHPSLRLTGNGYNGIGIPDCIRGGKDAAESI